MTWFFYSNKAVRRDRHLPLSVMSTTEGERDKGVALLKPVYDPRGEGSIRFVDGRLWPTSSVLQFEFTFGISKDSES
jgi:hypothetical protein